MKLTTNNDIKEYILRIKKNRHFKSMCIVFIFLHDVFFLFFCISTLNRERAVYFPHSFFLVFLLLSIFLFVLVFVYVCELALYKQSAKGLAFVKTAAAKKKTQNNKRKRKTHQLNDVVPERVELVNLNAIFIFAIITWKLDNGWQTAN